MKQTIIASFFASLLYICCAAVPVFAADVNPPSISAISPTTVMAGVGTAFSATYDDHGGSGVSLCRLMDNQNTVWTGFPVTPNAVTGSVALTYSLSAGTHYLQFQCQDNGGNWGYSPVGIINVNGDVTPPRVGFVSPNTATAGAPITFSASYDDVESGVYQCRLLDGGNMIWTGSALPANTLTGTASVTQSLSAGTHYLQFQCRDNAGNWGSGAQTPVTVVPTTPQSTATVGVIQQNRAISGVFTVLTAPVSGVSLCSLYVNGMNVGSMTIVDGLARTDYVLGPSSYVHVECSDIYGNVKIGQNTLIETSASPIGSNISYGTLIKLVCPGYVPADHPCKAVYYFGTDGKRHPFPNEKVYFSWYPSFGGVQEINETTMANIPLGTNVRYRPGVRMVKFTTVPRVYAVSKNETLRWIATEALAAAFYTSQWNKEIDDLPDTVYANYNFGPDITDVSQYNPVKETNDAVNIDKTL